MANYAGGNAAEVIGVVGTIDPASISASTVNTDAIDMMDWSEVLFIIVTGALGASATADFAVNGDTASGGSYATAITGKSITQLVKASNDNDQVVVRVTAEEVAAQSLRYIRGSLTIGTAASIACVVALGFRPKFTPASEYDSADVQQIVM